MNVQTFRYVVEFAPVWLLDRVLAMLPRPVCLRLGELLGWAVSLLMLRRNALMDLNLARTFPDKNQRERNLIRRGVWKNLGRVVGEFVTMGRITPENFRSYLQIENEHLIRQAEAEGKGVILVGFHFGNWELSGLGGKMTNERFLAVARPIKNPFVQAWVQRQRGAGGVDFILHRQAVKGCFKALKEKKSVGILVDQNLYTGGVFVDFLGRPAATTTLPGLLHARTGAPVVLLYCLRDGDKMKLIYEPMPSVSSASGDDSVLAITQAISRRLGELVRAHPEQWFWVHNRWKRQPA